ncbi:MAG: MaoC family dehydratase [Rhodobacteraceae bacterium]|nr:MaoC family dehydratase [Paracoccaceae bacterium]
MQALTERLGEEVGLSPWFRVDQARIDAFAEVTEDRQFIHVDPERAAQTPFGGTIAHGYLTLSMLSYLVVSAEIPFPPVRASLNYGFDKVRFLAPVRAGARIRGRFTLKGVEERPGGLLLRFDVAVEVEGSDRPALSADWLVMLQLA